MVLHIKECSEARTKLDGLSFKLVALSTAPLLRIGGLVLWEQEVQLSIGTSKYICTHLHSVGRVQSAQMKLSGSKIVISFFLVVLSPCGFFCLIAMCL
jgi:hypothetical protein